MFVKTIELPIYYAEVVVIIDNWVEANKKFKLELKEGEFNSDAITIVDEDRTKEVYILFKSDGLTIGNLCHELVHLINAICISREIELDRNNDEPIAYLSGYLAEEIYKIFELYKEKY